MERFNTSKYKLDAKFGIKVILLSISLICIIITMNFNLIKNTTIQNYASKSSSITIESTTAKIISGNNVDIKLPMASTTKVLTAILACESGKLDEMVTIPKEAVGVEGSSIYLKEKEKISLRDLVYGLMLRSGNDSAVAIAIFLSGSVTNFATKMNEFAKDCGAFNSNFTNPHGLHDDNHYTTAYDLAIITAKALKNPDFKKIVSTKQHKFKDENGEVKVFINKNKMLSMCDNAIGVKTGYTQAAGRCLVSAVEKDDIILVSVVLNHPDMWNDSISMLTNGLKKCKMLTLVPANTMLDEIKLEKTLDNFGIYVKEDLKYPIFENESLDIQINYEFDQNLSFPITKDEKIGKILIYTDNHLIFNENIYTMNNIDAKGVNGIKTISEKWCKFLWQN